MNDFKINYDKLRRLPIINYIRIIYLLIFLIIILIIIACHISIERKIVTLGFVDSDVLKLEVKEELSDKIKNNTKLIFNNKPMNYKIVRFGEYEYINNIIYEQIDLIVDRYVYQNEVGQVTIVYDKEKIIKYIFDLFK